MDLQLQYLAQDYGRAAFETLPRGLPPLAVGALTFGLTLPVSPWPYLLGGVLVMLVLASPALSLVVGQVDDRALPRDDPAAVASQFLDERFPGFDGAPYELLLRDPSGFGCVLLRRHRVAPRYY